VRGGREALVGGVCLMADRMMGDVRGHWPDLVAAHNQKLIDRIRGVPAMPATAESEADPCKPFSRRSDNRATLAQPVPRP
jgi:hypothetical protein